MIPMQDIADSDALQPTIRTCQILIGAMLMGVVMFLVIIVFVTRVANPARAVPVDGAGGAEIAGLGHSPLALISYAAVAIGLMNLILAFFVPKSHTDRTRRQIALEKKIPGASEKPPTGQPLDPASTAGKLAQLFQTQLIIGAALLEGGAFFAAVAIRWIAIRWLWRPPPSCSSPWPCGSRPRAGYTPGLTASASRWRRIGWGPCRGAWHSCSADCVLRGERKRKSKIRKRSKRKSKIRNMRPGGETMEAATVGQVIVTAVIENLFDLNAAEEGRISADQVRRIELSDARIDTWATLISMPRHLIDKLGLRQVQVKTARTATGTANFGIFEPVKLTINERDCECRVSKVADSCPVLIGFIPLEMLDFVVDLKGQRLIGNPDHGGDWMIDMY